MSRSTPIWYPPVTVAIDPFCTIRNSTVHVWEVAGGPVALLKFDAGSPVSAAICWSSGETTAPGVALQPAGRANVAAGGFPKANVWVSSRMRGAAFGAV